MRIILPAPLVAKLKTWSGLLNPNWFLVCTRACDNKILESVAYKPQFFWLWMVFLVYNPIPHSSSYSMKWYLWYLWYLVLSCLCQVGEECCSEPWCGCWGRWWSHLGFNIVITVGNPLVWMIIMKVPPWLSTSGRLPSCRTLGTRTQASGWRGGKLPTWKK